jgi:hypothetical protein
MGDDDTLGVDSGGGRRRSSAAAAGKKFATSAIQMMKATMTMIQMMKSWIGCRQ